MTIIYIFWLCIIFACLYFLFPWIYGHILRKIQKKKALSTNTIFLTFDDGPGNRLTPQILAILKENGIKATFFLLGRNISGREHLVQSSIKDGHMIASHSYSHLHAWKVLPWKLIHDIKKGWSAVSAAVISVTVNAKHVYRPPCGKLNLFSLLYLWICNVPIIFWTVDCLDTWPESKRNINYAAQKIEAEGGGIVLFHDFDRATDSLDSYVLASLNAVIQTGKELGYNFSTIDKLYKKRN